MNLSNIISNKTSVRKLSCCIFHAHCPQEPSEMPFLVHMVFTIQSLQETTSLHFIEWFFSSCCFTDSLPDSGTEVSET